MIFNKEIGHDPLTLTSKEAKQYYNYLLNKMEHNLISYSTGSYEIICYQIYM